MLRQKKKASQSLPVSRCQQTRNEKIQKRFSKELDLLVTFLNDVSDNGIFRRKMKCGRGTFLKFYLILVLRTFVEFKWCISVCSGEDFTLPRHDRDAVSCSRFVSRCFTFSSPRPEKERCTVCDRVSHAKGESYPMHQL